MSDMVGRENQVITSGIVVRQKSTIPELENAFELPQANPRNELAAGELAAVAALAGVPGVATGDLYVFGRR
jgi:hypothetical protein